MRIIGIVLAAGAGERVGCPKALLTLGGRSYLAHAAAALARPGVAEVAAVLGYEAARVRREAVPPGLRLLENPAPEAGMLSSILVGIAHAEAEGADGLLIHPVDHPVVDAATVDRVVAALVSGARIAVPSWEGRRGHPAGFAREAWPELRTAPSGRGARAVLALHPDWVRHVPGDPGCVRGINTPEERAALESEWRRG